MISPSSGANFAPWPEQGEATTNGPPGRSRMKSSFAVQVYRQVASLTGAGSRPGSRLATKPAHPGPGGRVDAEVAARRRW